MKIQKSALFVAAIMAIAALFPHITHAASKANAASCCAEQQSCCESGQSCCN